MSNSLYTAMDGGVQIVTQPAAELQTVYLDFDGEATRYNGEIAQFDVNVSDSGLTSAQIAEVVAALNGEYAKRNVVFVTERPVSGAYSTIFVGKSDAIAYTGLAETIDAGNTNPRDNAFVNLDASAPIDAIIATISHEVGHIVFGETHAGEDLAAYAGPEYIYVSSGEVKDGLSAGSNQILQVFAGGTATNATIEADGSLYLEVASDTVVNGVSKGYDDDDNETSASFGIVNGVLDGYTHEPALAAAWLTVMNGGTISNLTRKEGWVGVKTGGLLIDAHISKGTGKGGLTISGGTAKNVTVDAGVTFTLTSITKGMTLINVNSNGTIINVNDGIVTDFENTEGVFTTLMTVDGGGLQDCTLHGSGFVQMRGGTAVGTTLQANHGKTGLARARIIAGHTSLQAPFLYDTTIGDAGYISAAYDASLSSTTILSGGAVDLGQNGKVCEVVAKDTYVSSGGTMNVYSGTSLSGELHVENGATVKINAACTVNFDATDRTVADDALVQGFANITGTDKASYTLTYKELVAAGNYKLADTSDFSYTVTATSDAGTVDSVSVGDTFGDNAYKSYSLAVADGNLCLVVTDKEFTDMAAAAPDEYGHTVGGTLNLLSGGSIAGALIGTANTSGDVTTTVTAGAVALPVIGGAKVVAGTTAALDNIVLNIAGGEITGGAENGGQLYTGGYAYGANENALDSSVTLSVARSTLKLTGGSVAAENLFTGAHARKGAWTQVTDTVVTVTDGEFHRIYGGGWAELNAKSEVTTATITVSGGKVDRIYAGGANAAGGETVTGSAAITVGGSASVDYIFLAGKNANCFVTGDVDLTLSGDAKELIRISGRNGNGSDNTGGVTSLNVQTNVDLAWLDYVDQVSISEGSTFNVDNVIYADASDLVIDFAIGGELSGAWTALGGDGLDAFKQARFTIDGGSAVYTLDAATGALGDSGYMLDIDDAKKTAVFKTLA